MNTPTPLARGCAALGLILLLAGSMLRAQQGHVSVDRGNADVRWQDLRSRFLPSAARIAPGRDNRPDPAVREQRESGEAAYRGHFLGIAEEARLFREQYPDHPKASEARLLEAKSLLRAVFFGDKLHEARAGQLAEAVKGDPSLPAKERLEVVMMAEHFLWQGTFADPTDYAAAQEESARCLMREFPGEAEGYKTLLAAVTLTEDPVKIRRAAQEVIASQGPFAAKAAAQVLLERYELIGKSLADVANTALGRDNFFEQCRGRQVLLYTWGAWSPGSIAYARKLAGTASPDVLLIGCNLDRDVEAAKARAQKEALPGVQYYNEGGIGSLLALLLKLNAAPLVYLTDRAGVIRDVGAQHGHLADRLQAAGNP